MLIVLGAEVDSEVILYIYTWNPNDPCFDWKRPCFGGG